MGFEAANPRFNLAVESPPHGDQDVEDRDEGYNFCPVHGSTLASLGVEA